MLNSQTKILFHLVDFPSDIRGLCKKVSENVFIIAVNRNMQPNEIIKTYRHELAHIKLNHHEAIEKTIQEIEAEAAAFC